MLGAAAGRWGGELRESLEKLVKELTRKRESKAVASASTLPFFCGMAVLNSHPGTRNKVGVLGSVGLLVYFSQSGHVYHAPIGEKPPNTLTETMVSAA